MLSQGRQVDGLDVAVSPHVQALLSGKVLQPMGPAEACRNAFRGVRIIGELTGVKSLPSIFILHDSCDLSNPPQCRGVHGLVGR